MFPARPIPVPAPRNETLIHRPVRRPVTGSSLDPRLSSEHQVIKIEPMDSPMPMAMPGPVLRQRPYMPHIQYWATESRASSHSYTTQDYDTSSEYSDPSERKRRGYNIADSCAIEDDHPDAVEDTMAVSDSAKLKGVYWPGMDLFDSATIEMRRKRNQKKDSSVVQQLELNSQEVEPLEFIFTPQGSFKRQRRISHSEWDDEDEAEIKMESPLPPKKLRPVLAHMDVNARRSRQNTRSMLPFASQRQYEERGRSIFDTGHEEWAPRRKRDFTVFQGGDEDDVTFGHPAGLNYLTSGFSLQPSPTPRPSFSTFKPLSQAFQFENKENLLPPFQQTYGDHIHNYHNSASQYHAFTYGSGQEQVGYPYNGHLYGDSTVYRSAQDDDDQRTITAPPSPATS